MKLSIVIPVYNTEPYLEACLDSCLRQNADMYDYELVIVNDGTKDNAMAIADRFAKEHQNITIISQENAGLSAARNAGLSASKGDYVWFVDSDDCIDKDAIGLIFNKIEEKPDIICIQAKRSDTDCIRNKFTKEDVRCGCDVLLYDYADWDRCVPYFIFNRQFLDNHKLRFYNGIYHEDDEFTPRAMFFADKVSVIDKPLYFYLVKTENTIMTSVNPKKSFDNIIVAESLSGFKEKNAMPDNIKQVFENHISLIINNSLANIKNSSKQVKKEFNGYLKKKKHLFISLRRSDKMKYKLEYVLFSVFCNYVGVYNFIQNFNKR